MIFDRITDFCCPESCYSSGGNDGMYTSLKGELVVGISTSEVSVKGVDMGLGMNYVEVFRPLSNFISLMYDFFKLAF